MWGHPDQASPPVSTPDRGTEDIKNIAIFLVFVLMARRREIVLMMTVRV